MRDLLIILPIIGIVLTAWRHPWVGIIGWAWVSLMNPHQLSWTLNSLPVAAAVGGSTLIGLVLSSDRKYPWASRETVMLLLFMAYYTMTLPFSVDLDSAMPLWNRVLKIDFMVLVTAAVLGTRRHIMLFIWAMVLSLAYYGVKGGAFTLATGGSYRVWGPVGTYIEGNNELALALIMTIPWMRFLQTSLKTTWAKRCMTVAMVLMAMSALGSHSRGALLALTAMAVVLWSRGPNKVIGAVAFVVVGVAMVSFMPAEWTNRMDTIKTYQSDESALGRLNAWGMAFNLAKDRWIGAGFETAVPALFAKYAPDPTVVLAAHSIYFMVMGEQGFPGLFLWGMLWVLTFIKLGKIRRLAAKQPETRWLVELGSMGQVCLVGYAVGGAFLSLAYWDMPYNVLAISVVAYRWLETQQWKTEPVEPLIRLPGFLGGKGARAKSMNT